MASSKPFFVDTLTVNEIANLGDEVLNSLDKRELSRALRTMSLAANKRINRLQKNAEVITDSKGNVTYKDISGKGIDFEALYYTKGKKFGLGRGKHSRNEIYKEFAKVRNFINAPSTTISGAIKLRQKRERALFSKTREQLTEGLSEAEAELLVSDLDSLMSDIYSEFHKWKEEYSMEGGYTKEQGKRVLKMLTRRVYNKGMSLEAARADVEKYYDKKYERNKSNEIDVPVEDSTDAWDALQDSENKNDWI